MTLAALQNGVEFVSCLTQSLVIFTTGLVYFPMGRLCCPGSWCVLSLSSILCPPLSLIPMFQRAAISRHCSTIVQIRLLDIYLESLSGFYLLCMCNFPLHCSGKLAGNLVIQFNKCNQRFAQTFEDRYKPFISYQILCKWHLQQSTDAHHMKMCERS